MQQQEFDGVPEKLADKVKELFHECVFVVSDSALW
jgi:hypothetical protein